MVILDVAKEMSVLDIGSFLGRSFEVETADLSSLHF